MALKAQLFVSGEATSAPVSLEKCDRGPPGLLARASLLCSAEAKWACDHNAFTPQCIDSEARAANYTSSLNLPDKTLQFVKDHPLMDDSVTPIDNRPKLIKKDVNYTQIVVDRTQALDGTFYDVMFISTGGFLGKIGKSTLVICGEIWYLQVPGR